MLSMASLPTYISELVSPYKPTRSLRSSTQQLSTPTENQNLWRKDFFVYSAPTLWNSLPRALRSQTNLELFKKLLKTHLYKNALKNVNNMCSYISCICILISKAIFALPSTVYLVCNNNIVCKAHWEFFQFWNALY